MWRDRKTNSIPSLKESMMWPVIGIQGIQRKSVTISVGKMGYSEMKSPYTSQFTPLFHLELSYSIKETTNKVYYIWKHEK